MEDIELDREELWGPHVAQTLWQHSGMTPADVDVANLHDGFSILAVLWLEAMGLCPKGEGFDFIQGGRIALDGALPICPSGANIGCGRMHGVPQVLDAILQVTVRAGGCQMAGAKTALATLGDAMGRLRPVGHERSLTGSPPA